MSTNDSLDYLPNICKIHEKKWRIITQYRNDLCLECFLNKWNNNLETNYDKRYMLSIFDSTLKYGPHFSHSFNSNQFNSYERIALINTINELLFSSDDHISRHASNCITILSLLLSQFLSIFRLLLINLNHI
jgi:hypothetical protein